MQVYHKQKHLEIAQVPPKTEGNNASNTLYPVNKGSVPAICSKAGLTSLTGQKWFIEYFLKSIFIYFYNRCIHIIISSSWISTILPFTFGGTNILCSENKSFSWTIPITSPPEMIESFYNFEGLNDHSFFISNNGTSTPRGT